MSSCRFSFGHSFSVRFRSKNKLRATHNICLQGMRSSLSKAFALGVVLVFCSFGTDQASARYRKPRLHPSSVPSIMVDETGTPIIMQGLERPKRAIREKRHVKKEEEC